MGQTGITSLADRLRELEATLEKPRARLQRARVAADRERTDQLVAPTEELVQAMQEALELQLAAVAEAWQSYQPGLNRALERLLAAKGFGFVQVKSSHVGFGGYGYQAAADGCRFKAPHYLSLDGYLVRVFWGLGDKAEWPWLMTAVDGRTLFLPPESPPEIFVRGLQAGLIFLESRAPRWHQPIRRLQSLSAPGQNGWRLREVPLYRLTGLTPSGFSALTRRLESPWRLMLNEKIWQRVTGQQE